MSALLSAENLCLFRGDRCLFTKLDFALDSGEMLLIEGTNGSGKTSLLRALAGFLELETGLIKWKGLDTVKSRQAFHSDIVWLSHRVGFKGDLTLIENLRFECGIRNASWDKLDTVLERLSLARLISLPFRSLSAGQQRRVALARMLLADAPLWLMDEPFTNLDTAGQNVVIDIVTDHLLGGGMCVMASHRGVSVKAPVKRILLQ